MIISLLTKKNQSPNSIVIFSLIIIISQKVLFYNTLVQFFFTHFNYKCKVNLKRKEKK